MRHSIVKFAWNRCHLFARRGCSVQRHVSMISGRCRPSLRVLRHTSLHVCTIERPCTGTTHITTTNILLHTETNAQRPSQSRLQLQRRKISKEKGGPRPDPGASVHSCYPCTPWADLRRCKAQCGSLWRACHSRTRQLRQILRTGSAAHLIAARTICMQASPWGRVGMRTCAFMNTPKSRHMYCSAPHLLPKKKRHIATVLQLRLEDVMLALFTGQRDHGNVVSKLHNTSRVKAERRFEGQISKRRPA